jgi:hypothetical protein
VTVDEVEGSGGVEVGRDAEGVTGGMSNPAPNSVFSSEGSVTGGVFGSTAGGSTGVLRDLERERGEGSRRDLNSAFASDMVENS